MKVGKLKFKKSKLVKMQLIKTKIYKKNVNNNNFLKINDIVFQLKKSFHLIFKYHANKKRILFIGTPFNKSDKINLILKNTQHILLPQSVWMHGILTNPTATFTFLFKNQNSMNKKFIETLLNLKKKIDLIVILDSGSKKNILKESYITGIPTIVLNQPSNIGEFEASYKISGNFKFINKKIRDNLFYFMLAAVFKKANLTIS